MDRRILAGRVVSVGVVLVLALLVVVAGCRPAASPPSAPPSGGSGGAQAPAAPAAPIVIKAASDIAADQGKSAAFFKLKEIAEKKLGDKVKIEVYPAGQLYPSDDKAVEAMQAGAVQMVAPTFEKWTPSMPRYVLFTLPYVFVNAKMMREALDSPDIGGKLWPDLEKKGLKYLAVWSNGFRHLFNSKREIKKPEDMKGLKFRVQAKDVFEPFFSMAGANAQVMAMTEAPQALQQGIVDGIELPYNAVRGSKIWDFAQYGTEDAHIYSGYGMATNLQFWNGLPADVRKGLEESIAEVTAWQWDYADKDNANSKVQAKDKGMKIYEPSPAELTQWATFFRPIHKQYENQVGADLLNALYALQKKYEQ